jgi:cytochrome c-type biogenesis protein CcmF
MGEHLLPGQLGHFFILFALIAAFLSAIVFIGAAIKKSDDEFSILRPFGMILFSLQTIMLIAAFITLYYIISAHYFEYHYVWQYSSKSLSSGFLFSSLWAGQEGSILLWALLQALLGAWLMFSSSGKLKTPVMAVVSMAQVFLIIMILGVNVFGIHFGSNPFILLRETAENINNPFFKDSFYLTFISDGNGLNPLLQNYWMLWHPPVLFLGYAATIIPFAYAIAGLWRKDYSSWLKPVIPWTVFSLLILGLGLLLGGAWAYEDLTFGGFWSWDPVENASLVPWLLLVAALHFMLIAKKRNQSFFPALLFAVLIYIFVIYAGFLTRSGILANTSAHAFGSNMLSKPLLVFLVSFIVLPLIFFILNVRKFPKSSQENVWSREFWMFIGALVLAVSSFQIIFTTSLPVVNKLFGWQISPPLDRVEFYNNWQLPFAVGIALLIVIAQYFLYGDSGKKEQLKKLALSFSVSLVLLILYLIISGHYDIKEALLFFALIFSVIASLDLLFRFYRLSGNIAALISHIGFSVFILGVLLAFAHSEIISQNTSGMNLGKRFNDSENQLLTRGQIVPLGEKYFVSYSKLIEEERELKFQLDFLTRNDQGKYIYHFSLFPSILLNEQMGNAFKPSTKRFINKDIFTYLTFSEKLNNDSAQNLRELIQKEITVGDTIKIPKNKLVFDTLYSDAANKKIDTNNLRVTVKIKVLDSIGNHTWASPVYAVKEGKVNFEDSYLEQENLSFRIEKISEKKNTILLRVSQKLPDMIIIKAKIFPFINVLWLGAFIMMTGFIIAIWRRVRKIIE